MNKKEKNVYVGCGPDIRDGFIHCDIRKFDHVDILSKSWELSCHMMEVNHIYSRHMLEHLTNFEADRALRDWFKALKTGGTVRIIVPDMDFHCRQWLEAEWTEDTLKEKMSDAKHSFSGFWGWQAECDPWANDYNTSYWDVHKSGYNEKRIKFLLERIGFVDVKTEIKSDIHLVAEATKPSYSGERQVGTTLDSIRKDHLQRYSFVSNIIEQNQALTLIDAACGVGYGSYLLAENSGVTEIYSYDISKDALEHALQNFNNPKINYSQLDLENNSFDSMPQCDLFISFETIEHLKDADTFIAKIAKQTKSGGLFIGSTPNQEVMPFIQQNFLFHTKHFTIEELKGLLCKHGFTNIEFLQQKREEPSNIEKIEDGQYIIFIAKKS